MQIRGDRQRDGTIYALSGPNKIPGRQNQKISKPQIRIAATPSKVEEIGQHPKIEDKKDDLNKLLVKLI